jgi:hypothetical protein
LLAANIAPMRRIVQRREFCEQRTNGIVAHEDSVAFAVGSNVYDRQRLHGYSAQNRRREDRSGGSVVFRLGECDWNSMPAGAGVGVEARQSERGLCPLLRERIRGAANRFLLVVQAAVDDGPMGRCRFGRGGDSSTASAQRLRMHFSYFSVALRCESARGLPLSTS